MAVTHLQMLWTGNGLVEIHPPGAPVPKLAVASNKDEWAEAARSLFSKRLYSEAMRGFKHAGLQHEHAVALAYHLREQALSAPAKPRTGTGISQADAFAKAAKQFAIVARTDELEQRTYFRIAAECFVRSGDDRKAGAAYKAAGEYTLAAQHFRKAGDFDNAVQVIKSQEKAMDPEVVEGIIGVARLHYIRKQDLEYVNLQVR